MTGAAIWAVIGLLIGLRNASRSAATITLEQTFGRVYNWGAFHRSPMFVPIIVAATSAAYWFTAREFERNLEVWAFAIFVNALVVHTAVDIDTHLLVRRVSRRAMWRATPLLVVAALAFDRPGRILGMLGGAAIGWALMALVRMLTRGDLGGGDVSMGFFLGWFLGWVAPSRVVSALVVGSVLAGAWVLLMVITRRLDRKSHIPYGPFLALGGVVALWGGTVLF